MNVVPALFNLANQFNTDSLTLEFSSYSGTFTIYVHHESTNQHFELAIMDAPAFFKELRAIGIIINTQKQFIHQRLRTSPWYNEVRHQSRVSWFPRRTIKFRGAVGVFVLTGMRTYKERAFES